MGLTMEMRKGFAREKAKRYRQGSKKKKGQLIEEYMELVGCTRHHAAWTLRCWGITVWEQHAGRPVKIVVGRRRSRQRTARIYDQQTVAALTKLWRHFGYLCGKRLAAALRLWLPTLLATDRCTQWTEMRAVPNKAQKWVFEQLLVVRRLLPFELLGVHSDNGGEFINAHLQRYCEQQQIDFTRSRAHRKNDNNFTEQKNFDVVRKHVGYARYDTPEAVALLNELYDRLRLMVNYVRPCAKLIEKTRDGARVRRRYDRPHTPCQRVLACEQVPEAVKQRLREQFAAIDPIALNDQIVHLQRRLLRLAAEHASPLARVG